MLCEARYGLQVHRVIVLERATGVRSSVIHNVLATPFSSLVSDSHTRTEKTAVVEFVWETILLVPGSEL
jgi:hypothetical protein